MDLCFVRFIGNTVVTAAVVETQQNIKMKTTLKLDFKFDSMMLVLYSPHENVVRLMYTWNVIDLPHLHNLTIYHYIGAAGGLS